MVCALPFMGDLLTSGVTTGPTLTRWFFGAEKGLTGSTCHSSTDHNIPVLTNQLSKDLSLHLEFTFEELKFLFCELLEDNFKSVSKN